MTGMSRRRTALLVLLAAVGLVVAWTGGFLLSSGKSRCVEGVSGGQCSGRYASYPWHTLGAVALILGGVLVVTAVFVAVRSRRGAAPFPS